MLLAVWLDHSVQYRIVLSTRSLGGSGCQWRQTLLAPQESIFWCFRGCVIHSDVTRKGLLRKLSGLSRHFRWLACSCGRYCQRTWSCEKPSVSTHWVYVRELCVLAMNRAFAAAAYGPDAILVHTRPKKLCCSFPSTQVDWSEVFVSELCHSASSCSPGSFLLVIV